MTLLVFQPVNRSGSRIVTKTVVSHYDVASHYDLSPVIFLKKTENFVHFGSVVVFWQSPR